MKHLKYKVKKIISLLLVMSMVLCTNAFYTFSNGFDSSSSDRLEETTLSVLTNDDSDIMATESETSCEAEEKEESEEEESSESVESSDDVELSDEVGTSTASPEENPVETSENIGESTASPKENLIETSENVEPSDDIEEKNATPNEIEETQAIIETFEIISTDSDIELIEEEIKATESEIEIASDSELIDYMGLDTLSQLTFNDSDAAVINSDVIKLNKDIELNNTVYFKNDLNLDLAGHTIYGPENDTALHIEGNFLLFNSTDEVGEIRGRDNTHPTIYVKDAKAEFSSSKIFGAKGKETDDEIVLLNGGDAIHIYDSDVLFSGAVVDGGEGQESDIRSGGAGGDAIVVLSAKSDSKLSISEGKITGGHGANGVGSIKPKKGAALIVLNKVYESIYFGKGLPGNLGGGSGGAALNIKTDKLKSQNLYYENYVLNAGYSGYSKISSVNEESIESKFETLDEKSFNAGVNDSYYSLHDLDNKNYLTTLKSQSSTGLCTAFATVAYAETALIKNYPDYVKNTLGKNIDSTLNINTWIGNTNELNLSEIYFGMQMFTQPKDEFGNAGLSKYVYDANNESGWSGVGSNSWNLAFTSTTWRSFVEEDAAIAWPSANANELINRPIDRNLLNAYTDKTVVHAKSANIHDASEYFNGTTFDSDAFIKQMKKDIIEHDGLVICMFTGNRQDYANFGGTNYSYVKNGVSYGNYLHSLCTTDKIKMINANTNSLGGHALYCIGWDNDLVYSDGLGTHTGAFICKNSWNTFTLIPFDNSFAVYYGMDADDGNDHLPNQFVDYITMDFAPAFSEYENNYFYDSGVGVAYVGQDNGITSSTMSYTNVGSYGTVDYTAKVSYESIANIFEIRNDKEKVKAISFFASEPGEYEVSLYRVTTFSNNNTLSNEIKDSNKLLSKNINATIGYNTVNVSEQDLTKGTKVAVKVRRLDKSDFGDVYFDSNEDSTYMIGLNRYGTKYETDEKGRSYFVDPNVSISEISNAGNTYVSGMSAFDSIYAEAGIGDNIVNTIKNNNSIKVLGFSAGANARIRLYTNNYITLDANAKGKFSDANTVTYTYPTLHSEIGNIEEPVPDDTDDTFVKYNTKADGTGTDYLSESVYNLKIADSLTLYAQYTSGSTQATLRFNSGGGTGSMRDMTRPSGTTITVPGSNFTRTGYIFNGYVDNNGNDVGVGDNITLDSDITLTAKWNERDYEIRYYLKGGSFIDGYTSYPKSRKYTEDKELPTSDKVIRPGYEFLGWYDNENYTNSPLTTTNIANTEIIATYYAKWKLITHTATIVFETKHGNKPANQYITNRGKVVKPDNISAIGYKFLYWYDNDEDKPYNFDKEIEVDSDIRVILSAKWEALTYKVTLNALDGLITSNDVTLYTYGVGAILPTDVTPNKNNMVFAGWYTDSNFTGEVVTAIKGTDVGDKIFYAKYNIIKSENEGPINNKSGSSPSGGGGSSRGGGTGGGRVTAGLNALDAVSSPLVAVEKVAEAANRETKISTTMKSIPVNFNTVGSEWKNDSDGDRHLTIKNEAGELVEAKNTFACIVTTHKDANGKEFDVQDFYYFDQSGKMYLGWLIDRDNTTYYFEAEPGSEHGKLARGWTEIGSGYYYFDGSGALQTNTTTPDGYSVDSEGKWVK